MKRTTMLVCVDAGAAGRVLLAHRGIELRWAVTLDEALAVLRAKPVAVCIVKKPLAKALLQAMHGQMGAPVIVLLDAEGFQRHQEYQQLGATALVSDAAEKKILEAVSALSGVSFGGDHAVPYSTVLEVKLNDEDYFLESSQISLSGIGLVGIPRDDLGLRARIDFPMMDPPVSVSAVLARTYDGGGKKGAWFVYDQVPPEGRTAIAQIVEASLKAAPVLPEPTGFSLDLAGAFTADIHQLMSAAGDVPSAFASLLARWIAAPTETRIPSWLTRVGKALTQVERSALLDGDPAWARRAVELRISRQRILELAEEGVSDVPPEQVLEFCRTLAIDAAAAPPAVLDDVTRIRAELLQGLYGASLNPGDAGMALFDDGEVGPERAAPTP